MKIRTYGFGIAAIACIVLVITASRAQDKSPDWMKLTAPGENHKRLDALAGKWSIAVRFPDERGNWTESPGTSEFRWTMGNRFLIEESRTTMAGDAFEWMGIHGYDNQHKHYTSAWIDNLGTGIDNMKGEWDEAAKTLTYRGEIDEPASGGRASVRWSMRIESREKFVTQMFQTAGDGKEEAVLEIIGTRAN